MGFIDRILRHTILSPKVLFRADSPVSGRVTVRDTGRERVLDINGQVHSVYYKRGDWYPAVRDYWGLLASPPFPLPSNPDVFMIGLGGATTIRLLHDRLGPASIVVAEADPLIVSVAREYFDLSSFGCVEVITGDGIGVMRALGGRGRAFDLLIDDAYFDATTVLSGPGRELFESMNAIAGAGATLVLNRPVDRPEDQGVNASLVDELRRSGLLVEVKSVRGAGWNDVIYIQRPVS